VGFHLADASPSVDALATLGPLAHGVLRQWGAEDALQASLVSSLVVMSYLLLIPSRAAARARAAISAAGVGLAISALSLTC
jgi:hypothetical protein